MFMRGLFMLTKGRTMSMENLESIAAAAGWPLAAATTEYYQANPARAFNDMHAIGDPYAVRSSR